MEKKDEDQKIEIVKIESPLNIQDIQFDLEGGILISAGGTGCGATTGTGGASTVGGSKGTASTAASTGPSTGG